MQRITSTYELFDASNNVYEGYTLINGIEQGYHFKYHLNGVISVKYNVVNGLMDGLYQEWDHLGNEIKNECYSNGIKVKSTLKDIHNIISLIDKNLFITETWLPKYTGYSSFFKFNDRSYCILIYIFQNIFIGIKIMDAKTCQIMIDTLIKYDDNIENNIIEIVKNINNNI